MDKLIEAVQARECLWDKSYRGHRNRFKLERYWNEVAAEVGTSSKYINTITKQCMVCTMRVEGTDGSDRRPRAKVNGLCR